MNPELEVWGKILVHNKLLEAEAWAHFAHGYTTRGETGPVGQALLRLGHLNEKQVAKVRELADKLLAKIGVAPRPAGNAAAAPAQPAPSSKPAPVAAAPAKPAVAASSPKPAPAPKPVPKAPAAPAPIETADGRLELDYDDTAPPVATVIKEHFVAKRDYVPEASDTIDLVGEAEVQHLAIKTHKSSVRAYVPPKDETIDIAPEHEGPALAHTTDPNKMIKQWKPPANPKPVPTDTGVGELDVEFIDKNAEAFRKASDVDWVDTNEHTHDRDPKAKKTRYVAEQDQIKFDE